LEGEESEKGRETDDKGEKLWSEQVQESEDKGAVLRPSMNMEKTPPRLKRTAALNNAFAPMAKGKMDVPREKQWGSPRSAKSEDGNGR